MDREIKVKAFSKSEKKFITEHGVSLAVLMTQQPLSVAQVEDLVFIQYTGLKDKNGAEIYEGDVVDDAVGRTWIVEYSEERASFEFSWNKNRLGKQVYSRFNKHQKPLEVLGNIHENPELLEVKS